ncbi:hypothetical protein HDU81_003752 [Chytriomyces hyalinus]|nr:hypothetical protein HDU81_003752 [Chytriomyces hyalinus]
MKGRLRDEFIGYVEILSKNGQMMCKCERRAAVTTNPDGMKTMPVLSNIKNAAKVGTDCLTDAPCSFVIGRLKKNKIPENTRKPSNTDNLTPLPSNPLLNVPKAISSTAAKPVARKLELASQTSGRISRKATKPVLDQPRTQRSNGILTKTGLYVTITDSGLRVGPLDNNVPKKLANPRGKQAILTTPPCVPTSSALKPEMFDNSNPTDNIPMTELSPANVEPDEHAVLEENASISNSELPGGFDVLQTSESLFDMSVAQFLSPSCSSSVSVSSDFQFDLSDFFANATGAAYLSMNSAVFYGTTEAGNQSHSWELRTNPLDLFSAFPDDTDCHKECASDFDSVFMDVFGEANSGFLDATTENREPDASTTAAISPNIHQEQTNHLDDLFFQLQGSTTHETPQSSPWLPILPEKDFQQYRSVSPSSSLSSVSSFTTSGSILSNSNFGSSPAPSRKRQYPSISANNVLSDSHSSTNTNIHSDSGSNRSTPELKKSSRVETWAMPSSSTPQKSAVTSPTNAKASITSMSLQQEAPEVSLRRPPSSMALNTRATPSRRSLMTPTPVPYSGSSNHAIGNTPFVQSVVGSVAGARAAAAAAARASVSKLGSSRASGRAAVTPSTATASGTSIRGRSGISGPTGSKAPAPSGTGSVAMSCVGRLVSFDSSTAGKPCPASPGNVGPLSKAAASAAATKGTKTFNAVAFEESSPAAVQKSSAGCVENAYAAASADPLMALLNWTGQDTLVKSVSEETPPWFPGMVSTTVEKDGGADLFDMLFNGPMDEDLSPGHWISGGITTPKDYGNDSSLMVQDDWLF